MNPKLFNQDYLKYLCQTYGLVPSKKYGQNFLMSPDPVEEMVTAADIKKEDTVVEIGPGFGVLTFALAERAKKVLAFEIEKKIKPYWDEEIKKHDNLEMVWGNILKVPSPQFPVSNYKLVANLPYQITSQVLRIFLEMEHKPEVMVLMVQKEVAERICAPAGEMSLLSVSVQYYGDPEIVAHVPRSLFWPVPAVDSAVIKINVKKNDVSKKIDTDFFFNFAKAGFSNRRKMLMKNLSSVVKKDMLQHIFTELGIDEKVRAQELSVEQWKKLVSRLRQA